MGKKYFKDFNNFLESSSNLLKENLIKSRLTFKYRNKFPSYGKLYATDDNKSNYIKLEHKSDLDLIENYFYGIFHLMANKPITKEDEEKNKEIITKTNKDKKKNKKKKK